MKAGIITIGDELLLGQTINTNLAKIGKELGMIGISVIQACTIQDQRDDIINTLNHLLKKVDLIIITGGLGPTNDDLTKETLTEYFNTKLILNEEVLAHVKNIFESKGREMLPTNIHQAMVPESCEILWNELGTAPGMWFQQNGKTVISLPGVPYEMINLIDHIVVPKLKEKFKLNGKYYRTLMVQGIGESFLAEKIKDWEDNLLKDGLNLAYLPTPGLIRLRITTDSEKIDKEKIEKYIAEIKKRLPQYVYGENDESIFQVVGELLKSNQQTLCTVESCTGGGIANSFVAFPGSSLFFQGGLITYSNELKVKLANVSPESLAKYGAVSEQVAIEMAEGGRNKLNTDFCIAVTGIAGPDGGTVEKPVGTVWIAIASNQQTFTKKFVFGNDRGRNIERTILTAANMLRLLILEE